MALYTCKRRRQEDEPLRSNDAYASNTAYAVDRPYSVNGLNQSISTGPATFAYDTNGNLTSDGSTNFAYDAENRLISASGAKNASLAYDPLGRLWQVTGPAGTTRFLYDGDRLVMELNGSGSVQRSYVHGPGTDEPLVWYEGTAGWARRFLHADHQGSIIAVNDDAGAPIAINAYDEYGIPNAGNVGRFGYTGQTWIPELGLWYYKARFYSPTLGRFLQTDPIGYDDQINLYAYVGNDPVNKTDPRGTRSESPRDDSGFKSKARERTTRTPRSPRDNSALRKVGGALGRAAIALGIATAINEEGEKRDKVKVYRIFGGTAGIKGRDDAGLGSYWTTEDPRQYDTRNEIRQRYALAPKWGNAITHLAVGEIEAGNPNITSWSTASPERQGNIVYKGGGPEMTIRNSLQNVSKIQVHALDLDD